MAELFRTYQEDYAMSERITRLGNVVLYQDGRKLCYQLYATVIAERDLDTEEIEFNFGGYWTMTTANHLGHIAEAGPTKLNYARGYATYEAKGISRFSVGKNI